MQRGFSHPGTCRSPVANHNLLRCRRACQSVAHVRGSPASEGEHAEDRKLKQGPTKPTRKTLKPERAPLRGRLLNNSKLTHRGPARRAGTKREDNAEQTYRVYFAAVVENAVAVSHGELWEAAMAREVEGPTDGGRTALSRLSQQNPPGAANVVTGERRAV